ncbi:nuclear apoptosis-inducing factor 1-like [Haliotis rubra]|uniref:nuclear apoptosis-inducing factor 1-like n=1 Tax=Haliotis rubra TaxID=36100 RepID=UPI001EE5C1D4|nr:nuclear apoptosis-inducing factor 1-like [Haliotis rubra]
MSMSQRKHNRHSNFSPSEISLLAEEVKARQSVLFGPFSSTVTNTAKIREWDEIATKLNACSSVQRSGAQIRKKWNDYKSQVKKKAIDVRRECCKTGGCPAPVGLSDLEHKVVSMIPQCQIEGITGGLESEVEEICVTLETKDAPVCTVVEIDEAFESGLTLTSLPVVSSAFVPSTSVQQPLIATSELDLVPSTSQPSTEQAAEQPDSERPQTTVNGKIR